MVGDLIRLAWEAEHDGRSRLRDALLTLAVAESSPGDTWAERCRARLVQDRPDHFLKQFATVDLALEDPRVIQARDRLRDKYPAAKVQSLLLRARASRGPFLGRIESIEAMIDDLVGVPAELENLRPDQAQASRGPIHLHRAARPVALSRQFGSAHFQADIDPLASLRQDLPSWEDSDRSHPSEDFLLYYQSVLLGLAFLMASIQGTSNARGS